MNGLPDGLLDKLIKCAQKKDTVRKSLLFSFIHNDLNVQGIFFSASQTLMIGIVGTQVAWQTSILNGEISGSLPNEVYEVIIQHIDISKTTKPFFDILIAELGEIAKCNGIAPCQSEIEELMGKCKTSDKKYDRGKGEKPFFSHWIRKNPTTNSLEKIQRYFGQCVYKSCCKYRITAAWSKISKDKSLDFINPVNVINEVEKKAK